MKNSKYISSLHKPSKNLFDQSRGSKSKWKGITNEEYVWRFLSFSLMEKVGLSPLVSKWRLEINRL